MTQLFAYSESYRQVQPASRDMGLSAATFRNTLLISQDAPHPNGPELAAQVKEYLANAQEGGGDDISVERAVKRLRAKITDIGTLRQAKNGQKTYLSKRIQVLEAEQREALQRETELAQVQAAIQKSPRERSRCWPLERSSWRVNPPLSAYKSWSPGIRGFRRSRSR
ncbi:MAG: hypothetical protein ACLR23_11955 [Clostridia bacterium]